MKNHHVLLLLAILLAPLAAPPAGAEGARPRTRLQVGHLWYDRFLSRGGRSIDETAFRYELRLQWELPAVGDRMRPYVDLQLTDYEQFGSSHEIQAGFDLDVRDHSFEGYLRRADGRPNFFVGEELARLEENRVFTRYGHRFHDDWETKVLAGWYRQRFGPFPPKDNDTWQTGASLRYRGWGYAFSPELELLYRVQDARGRNYDYDQRDLVLEIRSIPVEPLYLKFRWRYRIREYDTGDEGDSNFDRRDDRHQFRLQAYWDITDRYGLDLYAAREDVDSLKPGSSRITEVLGLSLRFEF